MCYKHVWTPTSFNLLNLAMPCILYLHCSSFHCYLVTIMTPSLYLLSDIALFINRYTVVVIAALVACASTQRV